MFDANYGKKKQIELNFGLNSLFGIFGVKYVVHLCMFVPFGIVDIEKPFAVINN